MTEDRSLKLIRLDEERQRRYLFLAAFRRAGSARRAIQELGVSKSTFYRTVGGIDMERIKQNGDISVLVIDDEAFKRHEIQESLLEQGLVCDLASCGSEALELVDKKSYTCVLTDQRMRRATDGMDGLKIAEHLLERDSSLPIILLTACATVPLTRQAFKRGLRDVVEYQTVEWSELSQEILELSASYLGRDQPVDPEHR